MMGFQPYADVIETPSSHYSITCFKSIYPPKLWDLGGSMKILQFLAFRSLTSILGIATSVRILICEVGDLLPSTPPH